MRWVLLIGLLIGIEALEMAPKTTRTELKVGRSLGPTETVEVKTREGGTARLVVARREGRRVGDLPPPANPANTNQRWSFRDKKENSAPNWLPPPVEVRSEVFFKDDKKNSRARKLEMEQGIPVITGVRTPDTPEDKKHVWRNARVINNVLQDGNNIAGNPGKLEWLRMEPVVSPVLPDFILAANLAETNRARGARGISGRVLHGGGSVSYPASLLYSPPGAQRRVEAGVRTPVLQYAHPELGVQPAKPVPEREPENHAARDQALAYFSHDIHSDRSPYAFEPGLEEEARVEVFGGQRSNSGKKSSHTFRGPNQASLYGKFTYKDFNTEKPFWEKVKEGVEYGMERMQTLTRPVVEPLVEASHKISENLGLSPGTRDLRAKLGSSGSVFLPALGLVAGGAALGLGAVAMGRYLDTDILKRSAPDGLPTPLIVQESLSRSRRSLQEVMGAELQDLAWSRPQVGPPLASIDWGSTPCAKAAFCTIMLANSPDEITLMEKKMATYLRMLHPTMSQAVSGHLDDVMAAINSRDCSVFQCRHRQR